MCNIPIAIYIIIVIITLLSIRSMYRCNNFRLYEIAGINYIKLFLFTALCTRRSSLDLMEEGIVLLLLSLISTCEGGRHDELSEGCSSHCSSKSDEVVFFYCIN